MTTITPFAPRHTTADLGDRLLITLPSRRNRFEMVLLGLWMVAWLVGEVVALTVIVSSVLAAFRIGQPGPLAGPPELALFGLFWLAVWTLGGLFSGYTWLWQVTGREQIEVSRQSLRLSRQVLGRGRAKTYLAEHIQDLRLSPQPWYSPLARRASRQPWAHVGQLAFDYGARTFRFADADEAEAKQILKEIQRRYPQYKISAPPDEMK